MSRPEDTDQVTFLRCPDAIPNRESLLNQVLWADRVASIWPDGVPTPRDESQEVALRDALQLREEGVFHPRFLYLDDMAFAASGLAAIPKDVLGLKDTDWSRTNTALLRTTAIDTPVTLPDEEEANRFLYPDKLPQAISRKLTTAGLLEVIEPDEEHPVRGLRAGSVALVPWLLTTAAQGICEREGDGWTLVPSNTSAIKALAEPKARARKDLAMAIGLPTLPVLREGVSLGDVLELRASAGFLQARADYRGHLNEMESTIRRRCAMLEPGSVRAIEDFQLAVAGELEKAKNGLRDLASRPSMFALGLGLASFTLSVVSAVVAPGVLPVLLAASAGASAAYPILTRERTPKFLRMSIHLLDA